MAVIQAKGHPAVGSHNCTPAAQLTAEYKLEGTEPHSFGLLPSPLHREGNYWGMETMGRTSLGALLRLCHHAGLTKH